MKKLILILMFFIFYSTASFAQSSNVVFIKGGKSYLVNFPFGYLLTGNGIEWSGQAVATQTCTPLIIDNPYDSVIEPAALPCSTGKALASNNKPGAYALCGPKYGGVEQTAGNARIACQNTNSWTCYMHVWGELFGTGGGEQWWDTFLFDEGPVAPTPSGTTLEPQVIFIDQNCQN